MEIISYVSIIESLMFVQTFIRPNINFVIGMLGRYQSNPNLNRWKTIMKYWDTCKEWKITCSLMENIIILRWLDI
jgi:hypothetical protein